ncbi:phage minor tail protein G [Klebsiella pneumoniae]|nr:MULTISPECIES: phage minor tail protein G [Klebsiella]MBW5557083.1 phage minor tail protein G [Klebsiella pneumoniae]MCM6552296.1 phage minor tail protein G [Klebsiella pneumoniae]MCX0257048.1 phage minor tail protein G [Klebsiella pneumoniae]MEB5579080.1 phage minor tail protein G [Klebsiella quasipneumoniae]MEB5744447.1 phage minor tail protein G [Klebsiella quasipneumoniae]
MSMFLKKDEFTHNGATVTITELSALQRITYLEYLAAEEKALSAISDDVDDQTMSAGLVSMSIRAGARLIALSLWHNDPKGPSEEELHQQVMSTWPAEAIGKAEMQIKLLSGMLAPVAEEEQSTDEDIDTTALGDEPVTAEKR